MNINQIKQLMRDGDFAEASTALEEMLATDGGNTELKMLYGTCRRMMGDIAICSRIDDELAAIPENAHNVKYQKYHSLRVAACSAAIAIAVATASMDANASLAPLYGIPCKTVTGRIYFDASGGIGSMSTLKRSVSNCSQTYYTLPQCNFKRDGYKFVGWDVYSDCVSSNGSVFQPGDDVLLQNYIRTLDYDCTVMYVTAVWAKINSWPSSYTTSFSASDIKFNQYVDQYGETIYQIPVVMDPGLAAGQQRLYNNLEYPSGLYSVPSCPYTRQGYTFAGWKYYSGCYDSSSDVPDFYCKGVNCGGYVGLVQPGEVFGEDVDVEICGVSALVATWEVQMFNIYFNANGGRVSSSSITRKYDAEIGSLPIPTRTGYTFNGWWTSPSGGTQISATTKVTANVTYYAHWTRIGVWEPDLPSDDVLNPFDITDAFFATKAVTQIGAVYDGSDVVGIVELKIGKVNTRTGTSRISATVTGMDGKKKTAKAVTVSGIDGVSPVTVSLNVKDWGTMTVTIGGEDFSGDMGNYNVQSAEVGGAWTNTDAAVYVDVEDTSMFSGEVIEDCLPGGEEVLVKNGKWSFAKAASVKYAKPRGETEKELIIDDSKGRTNLSGLKLTYTPKTGVFKGSFKVYALEGEGAKAKLKKYTANVTGFVIDGVGKGTATVKKPAASWPVSVE